ncbi:hypothetical protein L1987_00457 [Smallanthus sonchifolius]|uniref:Uncharacterized protein n=1 Tax=Smallanthus sonchifolius TaxID=185202 RepID=A0ACB9K2B7_9ASTR|nr:hypothetical protein L1987_00457 [Smallanthus sonchifolius]
MVGNFGVEVDGVSGLKSMVGNFRTSPENGSYGGDECCFDCYTTVEKKSSAWIAHRVYDGATWLSSSSLQRLWSHPPRCGNWCKATRRIG